MASILDKIQTIGDYQRAEQEFQAKKAASAQSLQTGNIDALSKKNIYATQVLSGAAATGDQNAYDNAKQHLASNGIDISTWAPDVQTGAQQANAARQAQYTQNPLFPLIKATTGLDQNANAAKTSNGDVITDANALTNKVLNSGGNIGAALGGKAPIQVKSWNNPDAVQPPIDRAVTTAPLTPLAQQSTQEPPTTSNATAPVSNGAANPTQNPNYYGTIENGYRAPDGGFLPPADRPDKNFAFNKAERDKAEAVYKSNKKTKIEDAQFNATGKDIAKTELDAASASSTFDRLSQSLDALAEINPTVPESSYGLTAEEKAGFSKRFGDHKAYDAFQAFSKTNQNQMLAALSELTKGGAIRGNQTIEKMLARGYIVDANASAPERQREINIVRNELENSKIAAQNTNNALTGNPAVPYTKVNTNIVYPADAGAASGGGKESFRLSSEPKYTAAEGQFLANKYTPAQLKAQLDKVRAAKASQGAQ